VRELLRRKHFVLEIDDEACILRRARTAAPFESLDELEWSFAELSAAVAQFDRSKLGQLVDVRLAPPRTDPDFEAVVMSHNAAMYRGFRATAVLVRSAAGRLHVKRMLDTAKLGPRVFVDEEEALQFLSAPAVRASGWRETRPDGATPLHSSGLRPAGRRSR
jgi:hypothetical protein